MIDQEVMSRVAAYRGNPAPLQQRYAASQNLIDLLALQKIKSEKEAAARQMQLQMSQQQAASGEMPPTVAQQREQEVMDLTKRELAQQRGDTMKQQQAQKMQQFNKLMGGIAGAPGAQTAAQPKAMAAGGIVAFNGGGRALDQARQRRTDALTALRKYGTRQRMSDPEGFKTAQEELQAAEAAVAEAEKVYAAEMSAAGMDRPDYGLITRRFTQGRSAGPTPVKDYWAKEDAEAAPPVSAVYPDETKRGTAAGLAAIAPPAPPAPEDKPTMPNVEVTAKRLPPTPPAAPAAAGIPAALPQGPAAPAMPGYLDKAMQADVERDPFKQQKDEEARITGLMAASPEEKAAMAKAIAQRQEFFDQQYNPERMRREGLISFLTGAGGRRYGEFGAGAQAARAYEEAQYAQRGKDFEAMEKSRLQPFERQREAVKGGIEGGLKSLEAASNQRRTGMQGAIEGYKTGVQYDTSNLDRAGRERVANIQAQAQRYAADVNAEANRIAKEGNLDDRAMRAFTMAEKYIADVSNAADKRFKDSTSLLQMKKQSEKGLSPAEQRLWDEAVEERNLSIATARREILPVLNASRARFGVKNNATLSKSDQELIDKHLNKGK